MYADYTASGRALSFIEEYINEEVLPLYANTHTLQSRTGIQSTLFREEARDIVLRCVNASIDDVGIFTGNGSTAAVTTFIGVLGLKERCLEGEKIVVLVGPYEHHSNLLPWREAGCSVEVLPEDRMTGGVDLGALEASLKSHRRESGDATTIIGSFSAGSNVTGILTDTNPITELLHRYGGLSVWDYAAAAPYVDIDMNPRMDSGERVSPDPLLLIPFLPCPTLLARPD